MALTGEVYWLIRVIYVKKEDIDNNVFMAE